MQELHRADRYLKAAESSRPGIAPAIKELLHLDVSYSSSCAALGNIHGYLYLVQGLNPRHVQVCPRCCLRYAGVRSDIYAEPAPTATALRTAVEGESQVSGNVSDAGACASAQQPAPESNYDTADAETAQGEALAARVAAPSPEQSSESTHPVPQGDEPPCRACLGILQSLDGPLETASEDLMAQLPETDGGGSAWMQVPAGDAASIAAHIR